MSCLTRWDPVEASTLSANIEMDYDTTTPVIQTLSSVTQLLTFGPFITSPSFGLLPFANFSCLELLQCHRDHSDGEPVVNVSCGDGKFRSDLYICQSLAVTQ